MQPHLRLEAAETLRCGCTPDVVKDCPPILNDVVVSVVSVVTVEEVVSVVVVEVVVFVV